MQQLVAQLSDTIVQQAVALINEEVFFSVPWVHHLCVIAAYGMFVYGIRMIINKLQFGNKLLPN